VVPPIALNDPLVEQQRLEKERQEKDENLAREDAKNLLKGYVSAANYQDFMTFMFQ
jgi:hypothetical protein